MPFGFARLCGVTFLAVAEVLIVRVEVTPGMAAAGENVHVPPDGRPPHANCTD